MTREKHLSVGLVVVVGLFLAGCAAGDPQFTAEEPAGFLLGLWHGFIALVTFVVGLFDQTVEIYERANNGALYDLGFLIGVGLFSGTGHQSHRRWSRGRRRSAG